MISSRIFADISRRTRMNKDKIKEQFHYFNIQADIDSVYGNWAVSTNGDVVNCVYPFVIISIHLHDEDWIDYLKTKVWYKECFETTLGKALNRANELLAEIR